MPDYQESDLTGKKWRRCFKITINNPLNDTPSFSFLEEDALNFLDAANNQLTVTQPLDQQINVRPDALLENVPFDPSYTFPVYDPTTMQQTGASMTYLDVYAILYSVYIDRALNRDSVINLTPNP